MATVDGLMTFEDVVANAKSTPRKVREAIKVLQIEPKRLNYDRRIPWYSESDVERIVQWMLNPEDQQ